MLFEMVEEQVSRIDDALMKMFNDLDKAYIRNIQWKMFKCAATCCEDKESSAQSVQSCIETCSQPLQKAQHYVQSEMKDLQDRIQRCVMGCNDTMKDQMGPEPSENEIAKCTKEFEKCAKKCVDFHLDIIPSKLDKVKTKLKRQMNQ